ISSKKFADERHRTTIDGHAAEREGHPIPDEGGGFSEGDVLGHRTIPILGKYPANIAEQSYCRYKIEYGFDLIAFSNLARAAYYAQARLTQNQAFFDGFFSANITINFPRRTRIFLTHF